MVNLIAAPMTSTNSVGEMPMDFRVEADLRIPLADGRRLSARMWIPVDADANPVPALVEYAPFRHRDFTYPRDAVIHPWFAGHGYASIRLEPAGSQDSDGPPMDEYVAREQADCVEALAWIAAQAWCSGQTGMFGMSWGAFSALQVAALRPPSLKAIIPVHGTDDRYNDDIHYKGGCLLCANLAWGALYQTYTMRPPDPHVSGADWREAWVDRMRQAPDILAQWIGHHCRDDYWKHASVSENYSQIEAATYVMCGWTDGYTNAALRMINGLDCPHRVLIGPWGHTYPHIALPGPQIGFLQEATRWWDRWLKGVDNGIDKEPPVRIYMQKSVPPHHSYTERDGRWFVEREWPSPHVDDRILHLGQGSLDTDPGPESILRIRSPLANAIEGGEWLPHGVGPEMPLDQRYEDGGSLCFDTPVLESDLEICGTPSARLTVCPDTSNGTLCVRLCDVAPDGQSTLVSYGLLDIARRNGLDHPEPVVPGAWLDIEIDLNGIAQQVPAGHRLRLAVSTQSWPLTWPTAKAMTLSVRTGVSSLVLPCRRPGAPDGDVPVLEPARVPQPADIEWMRPVRRERAVRRDVVSGEVSRTYVKDDGAYRVRENGMEVDSRGEIVFSSTGEDPLSARADLDFRIKLGRGVWSTTLETRLRITSDRTAFYITGVHKAVEGDEEVFVRPVDTRIPRDR